MKFYWDRPLLMKELNKNGYVVELPYYGNFECSAIVYIKDDRDNVKSETVAFDDLTKYLARYRAV